MCAETATGTTWIEVSNASPESDGGITSTAVNASASAFASQQLTDGKYWEVVPNNVSASPSFHLYINAVGNRNVYRRLTFTGGYMEAYNTSGSWQHGVSVTTSSVIRISLEGTTLKIYKDGTLSYAFTDTLAAPLELRFTIWEGSGRGLSSAVTNTSCSSLEADAGPDKTAKPGQLVTLSAAASTGAYTSVSWTQIAGTPVMLSGANSCAATFTVPTPGGDNTELAFSLTISDGASQSQTIIRVGVVKVTTNDQVIISDPNVSFIIGPQIMLGSPHVPLANFDTLARDRGDVFGSEFPRIPPLPELTGTVSVSNGSSIVTGTGTRFLTEIDPSGPAPWYNGWLRIHIGNNEYRQVQVAAVQSDTQLTLTSSWSYSTVANVEANTYYKHPAYENVWNYDHYEGEAEYYDLTLVQYTLFYRTGLTKYRDHARKIADSRWMSQYINYGTVLSGTDYRNPRQQNYAGLMLRALDGRPEFWDYIFRTTRAQFDNWVFIRRTDIQLYGDLREGGFANLYAVLLAKVLPDSYPLYANGTRTASTGTATDGMTKRSALLADIENVAINYFGRLQHSDGSWRWNEPQLGLVGIEQPFMVGLYLEGAILLHQLTTNSTVQTNLANQLADAAMHLYNDAYRLNETVSDLPTYRWRALWYFDRGGPSSSPNLYDTGIGNVNTGGGDPWEFGVGTSAKSQRNSTGGDINKITQERNLQSMITHVYGYLYLITGNPQYRSMGDELLFSAFGDDGVPPAPEVDLKQKIFSQTYRSQSRYLVWRLP